MSKVAVLTDSCAGREMAAQQLNCVEISISEMAPILSVHIGPNSLSPCYVPVRVLSEP
jgi:fatty acid-binding protein DegV